MKRQNKKKTKSREKEEMLEMWRKFCCPEKDAFELSLTRTFSFFRTCFSAAPLLGRRKDGKVVGSEDVVKCRVFLLFSFSPFLIFSFSIWSETVADKF